MINRRQLVALGAAFSPIPFIRTADAQTNNKVLRFSWWGGSGRHEATLKALRLFEEKNPGVKIKAEYMLSLIHISEPTRRTPISYAVFCLKIAQLVFAHQGQQIFEAIATL